MACLASGNIALVGYQNADDSYLYHRIDLSILNNYLLSISTAYFPDKHRKFYTRRFKKKALYFSRQNTVCSKKIYQCAMFNFLTTT